MDTVGNWYGNSHQCRGVTTEIQINPMNAKWQLRVYFLVIKCIIVSFIPLPHWTPFCPTFLPVHILPTPTLCPSSYHLNMILFSHWSIFVQLFRIHYPHIHTNSHIQTRSVHTLLILYTYSIHPKLNYFLIPSFFYLPHSLTHVIWLSTFEAIIHRNQEISLI